MALTRRNRATRIARRVLNSWAELASFTPDRRGIRIAPSASQALQGDWERLRDDMRRAAEKIRDAEITRAQAR